MVDLIQKRLQVFVSSTYLDLKFERQAAVEAILVAGHIPAGMELFSAGDESQMDVIKQWIDDSDVYVLILGGRYGSVEKQSGKSYTHLEYEYAAATGKPLFACVINDAALEKKVREQGVSAIETGDSAKLNQFRDLVKTKMVKFWDDHKDIKLTIIETLSHLSRREDLAGWVRAQPDVDMPALAEEIARLSKENSDLRDRLSHSSSGLIVHGLSYEELVELLISKKVLKYFLDKSKDFGSGIGLFSPQDLRCEVLSLHGLVAQDDQYGNYFKLTDEGRSFLNRYQLHLLRESKVVGKS